MGKGKECKSVPHLDLSAPNLPTKGEIKAIIPKECFERSYIKGLFWILFDVALASLLVTVTKMFLPTSLSSPLMSSEGLLWLLGWNLYAFCMGSIILGLWVLGHEAGHGALFPSVAWNNFFGFIIHQAVLTPYFAWRYTHAKHHQYTKNLHRDTDSHAPKTLKEMGLVVEKQGNSVASSSFFAQVCNATRSCLAACSCVLFMILWFPSYLFGTIPLCRTNFNGSPNEGERQDHFNPNSVLLPPKLKNKVVLSTATFAAAIVLLVHLSLSKGFWSVALWYGFPLLWAFFWGYTYTLLHHRHPSVPFYSNSEWTWMKGSLSSIDRDYGIFNFFHHQIGRTHVCHHIFHEIPFYNSVRATRAIRDYLEPKGLYNFDPSPWPLALWRTASTRCYLSDINGIQYEKRL